ncbi:hypothetical protein OSB04_009452, partial [Centaurea solstitialis]
MASSQPSKKTNKSTGGGGGGGASSAQNVKFARRTSSGRYVSLSKDDIDEAGETSGNYTNYTVHIPSTPDNLPTETSVATKAEEQYVSNSLFTGGFNSVTRAHLMDKVTDSDVNHPQMAGLKGSLCSMPNCGDTVMKDDRGVEIIPCECRFKICRDCFLDAQKDTGLCPGCKEPYRTDDDDPPGSSGALALQGPDGKRTSVVKKNQNGDFDHNKWLFNETSGTYGVGNAYWPPEEGGGGGLGDPADKPWRAAHPDDAYRCKLLIAIRFVVLCFFLAWRIQHPNPDAMWLWFLSVVCELWFGFSWILDQIPKISPVNRSTDLKLLHDKFEMPDRSKNPTGRSDLPGLDFFVSTADPEKEPPLVTANTILSILAVEYPVEKVSCYISDDGGALLTFEAMAEACSFADLWVPFCRKHDIEPRNPDTYFSLKGDPTKNKKRIDFVKDRRRVKREYDEFKVRINNLPDSIRRRSDAFNAREEMKMMKNIRDSGADPLEPIKVKRATWMADGTHWPGTWTTPSSDHKKGDHAGILQVMLKPPSPDWLRGSTDENNLIDFSDVDIRLPMFVYMSREKRSGYDHNKKAGAMNALVRSSAVLSNGPFILNLDCDHYINNTLAVREGICFMMDRGGEDICYIQYPQRFEGIDPSDRYANHNTVFFDGNMRALDGLQGPFYVGTGCMFRRFALYGFDPPKPWMLPPTNKGADSTGVSPETQALKATDFDPDLKVNELPRRFGNSTLLAASIPVAEFQGRPIADHPAVKYGRPPGVLRNAREPLDATTVAESVSVISCWYEDKTEWGDRVGWIYGSVTEDVVTGYRMHNRGWRSIYCLTKRDAFRGSAPINLTDRLHQVLRWATGSKQRFSSIQTTHVPTTSGVPKRRHLPLHVPLPPRVLLPSGPLPLIRPLHRQKPQCHLLSLPPTNNPMLDQPRRVGGPVVRRVLRRLVAERAVLADLRDELPLGRRDPRAFESDCRDRDLVHVDLESGRGHRRHFRGAVFGEMDVVDDPANRDRDGERAGDGGGVHEDDIQHKPAMGEVHRGAFFSFWVLAHLYPFFKGLMGRRGKTPTIVFVWSGLIAITLSLLWVAINPNAGTEDAAAGGA